MCVVFQQLVSLTLVFWPPTYAATMFILYPGWPGRVIDGFFFSPCSCDVFAPTETTLQPRPVANRQYYTLPNNGAGMERRTSAPPVSISVESPRFHPHAKGKNIRLDGQLRRATRKNSFCNGITFSHRPVHLYEKVCFSFFLPPLFHLKFLDT